MSIISADVVKDFYTVDQATGWYSPKLGRIQNQAQAQVVESQLISDARMERLKSAGIFVIAAGAAVLLAGVAFLAMKVSSLFIGIIVFPLAIIPPLYGLVTTLVGLAVGGTVGHLTIKKYAKEFLNDAKAHWNYADHLYSQAHAVSLKKAELKA